MPAFVLAEMRDFVGANGQTMRAELVSHKGGEVTLRREDGREFSVAPNVFSLDDQVFLKNWMEKTLETISYNFRIDADKTKVQGSTENLSYKRVKNEKWAYNVEITNLSRDSAKDLTVLYKILYTNNADGSFSASSFSSDDPESQGLKMVQGEAKLSQELPYNKTMAFLTKQVQIDLVDYDGAGSRYKDEMKGCLIRIVDAQKKVVFDWKADLSSMSGKTWENTEPRDKGSSTGLIIR